MHQSLEQARKQVPQEAQLLATVSNHVNDKKGGIEIYHDPKLNLFFYFLLQNWTWQTFKDAQTQTALHRQSNPEINTPDLMGVAYLEASHLPRAILSASKSTLKTWNTGLDQTGEPLPEYKTYFPTVAVAGGFINIMIGMASAILPTIHRAESLKHKKLKTKVRAYSSFI
jgi:hypothetical protein